MFSPALGRVVRATALSTSSFSRVTGSQQSLVIPAVRQRRLSSSKASVPPNAAKPDAPAKVGSKKMATKGGKKKAAPVKAINVPHVPPTNHLNENGMWQPRGLIYCKLTPIRGWAFLLLLPPPPHLGRLVVSRCRFGLHLRFDIRPANTQPPENYDEQHQYPVQWH